MKASSGDGPQDALYQDYLRKGLDMIEPIRN